MKNIENIETWLEEMDYFEFSKLLEIQENPLSITLGFMHENDINLYNRIIIKPKEITNWQYNKSKKFFPSESTEIRQVELIDNPSSNINIKFVHSYSEIILECKSFEVENISPIKIKPKLRFNESWVTLSAPPQIAIKPIFWLKELKKRSINAVFRMYGDVAKDIKNIPEDYTGYCIAKHDRLNDNPTGIFISASKSNSESMYVILQCQDEESYDLWIELIDVFSELDKSTISIGDVNFNQTTWRNNYKNEYQKRL